MTNAEVLTPPFKAKLEESVQAVFETMIPLPLETKGTFGAIQQACEAEVVSSLGFTGTNVGGFLITTTKRCAQRITATLLFMDSPDEASDEDLGDAMGEVANMIGGGFKNFLVENGIAMELATPSVVEGSGLQSFTGEKSGRLGFTIEFGLDSSPLFVAYYTE